MPSCFNLCPVVCRAEKWKTCHTPKDSELLKKICYEERWILEPGYIMQIGQISTELFILYKILLLVGKGRKWCYRKHRSSHSPPWLLIILLLLPPSCFKDFMSRSPSHFSYLCLWKQNGSLYCLRMFNSVPDAKIHVCMVYSGSVESSPPDVILVTMPQTELPRCLYVDELAVVAGDHWEW